MAGTKAGSKILPRKEGQEPAAPAAADGAAEVAEAKKATKALVPTTRDTGELIQRTAEGLRAAGVELSLTGATFPAKMEREEWAKAGTLIAFLEGKTRAAMNFALGDWYRYGKDHFQHAEDLVGSMIEGGKVKTIQNYATIASKFPNAKRDIRVTWTVYAELAYVEPEAKRFELLKTVASGKVPTTQVRAMVSKMREERLAALKAEREAQTQPAWNDGKGGGFGDAATDAEKAALADAQAQYDAQVAAEKAAGAPQDASGAELDLGDGGLPGAAENGSEGDGTPDALQTTVIALADLEKMIRLPAHVIGWLDAIRGWSADAGQEVTRTGALELACLYFMREKGLPVEDEGRYGTEPQDDSADPFAE